MKVLMDRIYFLLVYSTFYHSQSCLPMLHNERDSEEEEGIAEWLKKTSMKVLMHAAFTFKEIILVICSIFGMIKMVDEFIDVNFGEKQFMKTWNSYMMENR